MIHPETLLEAGGFEHLCPADEWEDAHTDAGDIADSDMEFWLTFWRDYEYQD